MNTTAITTFNNEEFGNVRTLTIDGDPWFVGKDIAECLGYSKARMLFLPMLITKIKRTPQFRAPLAEHRR